MDHSLSPLAASSKKAITSIPNNTLPQKTQSMLILNSSRSA